jgi:uncharacterized protein YecE (DUF72 family)
MPPSYHYSDANLEKIINSLNPSFKNVLELRHVSWWRDDVYEELAKNNVTFCSMSYPTLPDAVIANTDVVYYRFHGVPELYRSRYSIDFLQKIIDDIKSNHQVKEAWCYFNNDYDAIGVFNAKGMMGLVG